MSVTFSIKIAGLDGVERGMESLTNYMSDDLRPFFKAVRSWWYSTMTKQFESEGAYAGDPWRPLTPKYARWKAKKFPGTPILTASGKLRRAVSGVTSSGAQAEIGKQQMELGVDAVEIPYWAVHNFGSLKPDHIPMRKYATAGKTQYIQLDKKIALVLAALKRKMAKDSGMVLY